MNAMKRDKGVNCQKLEVGGWKYGGAMAKTCQFE
jgi:hypothetical protein